MHDLQGHEPTTTTRRVWQFEGYGYVPSGTFVVSVMQIHNEQGAAHGTVLMLHTSTTTRRPVLLQRRNHRGRHL